MDFLLNDLQEPIDDLKMSPERSVGESSFTIENSNDVKKIILTGAFKASFQKEHLKRKVTNLKKWNFTNEEITSYEIQWNVMKYIYENMTNDDILINDNKSLISIYVQEIKKKIYGYKSQDQIKNIYNETQFIDFGKIMQLFINCEMKCFYCKNCVKIIYERVREPNQWSLERINNNIGHNVDNVVIACLNCNLKRNTMYHERFVFTKQMNIKKI